MATSEPKPGGIIESVKRVGETALALLHNRLQLFAVELQEEKYRAVEVLLLLSAGVILVFLGLSIGVGTVAIVAYNLWGLPGLVGLTILLLAAGIIFLAVTWNRLKSDPPPFSGTLQELRKDREWFHRKN